MVSHDDGGDGTGELSFERSGVVVVVSVFGRVVNIIHTFKPRAESQQQCATCAFVVCCLLFVRGPKVARQQNNFPFSMCSRCLWPTSPRANANVKRPTESSKFINCTLVSPADLFQIQFHSRLRLRLRLQLEQWSSVRIRIVRLRLEESRGGRN